MITKVTSIYGLTIGLIKHFILPVQQTSPTAIVGMDLVGLSIFIEQGPRLVVPVEDAALEVHNIASAGAFQ